MILHRDLAPGSRLVLLAGVLVLLFGGCATRHVQEWFRATGPGALPDGGGTVASGGVTVRVRETFGSDRAQLLTDLAGVQTDPFAPGAEVPVDAEIAYRTFLVEIDNQSGQELRVNPSFSTLEFGGHERYPIGYSGLYRLLRTAGSDEIVTARLAPLFEETYFTVPNGGHVRKLFVFDRIGKGVRKVTMVVAGLALGDKESSATFELERFKE